MASFLILYSFDYFQATVELFSLSLFPLGSALSAGSGGSGKGSRYPAKGVVCLVLTHLAKCDQLFLLRLFEVKRREKGDRIFPSRVIASRLRCLVPAQTTSSLSLLFHQLIFMSVILEDAPLLIKYPFHFYHNDRSLLGYLGRV